VLAGRPGTGKTTLGRLLAGRLQAAYLRTDVLVAPMLRAGLTADEDGAARVGYDIAREVATENLHAGVPVVIDGVNASHERRALWRDVAGSTQARHVQLETMLPDREEHRLRVDRRASGVGYVGPTWEQILSMEYDVWHEPTDGQRLLVDTSDTDAALAACLAHVLRPGPA
jgi:predicted kinase